MEGFSLVYITVSGKEEAVKIAKRLVGDRLVACVNIIDGNTSVYEWDGDIREEKEALVLAKTRTSLFPEIDKIVKQMHSYECPCVMSFAITDVSKGYADWLIDQTKR